MRGVGSFLGLIIFLPCGLVSGFTARVLVAMGDL